MESFSVSLGTYRQAVELLDAVLKGRVQVVSELIARAPDSREGEHYYDVSLRQWLRLVFDKKGYVREETGCRG